MEENNYINKVYPVYFSYSGNKDGNSELEKPIEELRKLLSEANIDYRDYKVEGKTPFTYRRPMMESEEEIGSGHLIVVVLSISYIESSHCMYEWYNIVHNPDYEKRIFPIYLEDLRERLNDPVRTEMLDVILSKMYKEIALKEANSSVLSNEEKFILGLSHKAFKKELGEIIRYYRNNSVPKLERFDYEVLLKQIQDRINELEPSPDKPSPNVIVENQFSAPSFKFATQSNLVGRDNMVEKLHDLVSKNSFSNLHGFGGSGKTSLTYLFLQKYRPEFNQVAYIVVNNDIKADFVSQINDTIHLFKPEENKKNGSEEIQDMMKNAVMEREIPDRYQAVISYLESNYKSDKPNLLIIDINNVPDGDIAKFGDDLANNTLPSNKIYPDGWKYLIVSREKCRSLAKMNLNKNESQNTVFLKELFLKNAGDQYKDFSEEEFAELFKTIYYSPLLAEQLGMFLQDFPKKSVSQIREILHRDSFRSETRTGITSQNRSSKEEKTIIGFLRNIIVFDGLKEKEKTLLKHFVLWPTDYIPQNVIFGLLEGLFSNENELENALFPLVKRRIIAVQEVDGISNYKLHGLLAESLREQIDIPNEDYDKYLDNIERITKCGYYDFLPYVDCIGHSLCEFKIAANYQLINIVGQKLNESWKYDYAHRLLSKNIRAIEDSIKRDENNHYLQSQLIIAHTFIGDIQHAKLNYEKAVEILEQMPENIEKYQHALALAYRNLATKQSKYENVVSFFDKIFSIRQKLPKTDFYQLVLANDYSALASISEEKFYKYSLAKKNYEEAIGILERLPKDNPEYQNNLASTCNNLANLQQDHLGDYPSAKSNCEKALAIREKLPKENPEYQNGLAWSYNNLANLQQDHLGEYESAKSNYKKAIAIREKLPKENPEYQNGLASTYYNLANLQQGHLGEYPSAKSNYEKALAICEELPKENPEYQNNLAWSYNSLAYCYKAQKYFIDAVAMVNKAIDIAKGLSDKDSKYLIDWVAYNHSLAEIIFDNNEVKKAKEILDEIKPLAEKCLAENPNDNWTQIVKKGIDDLLEKCANL